MDPEVIRTTHNLYAWLSRYEASLSKLKIFFTNSGPLHSSGYYSQTRGLMEGVRLELVQKKTDTQTRTTILHYSTGCSKTYSPPPWPKLEGFLKN